MGHAYQSPEALPHGELEKIGEDIFFVTGSCKMSGMCFSRNMVVLRQGIDLTLVNTIRLSSEGLQQLESLGRVKHIVRLAAFHGMDDPFYKKRYNAEVWSVNAPYTKSFNKKVSLKDIYFTADTLVANNQKGPIENSSFIVIDSAKPQEALLHINVGKGLLISGDALQNWQKPDAYFNWLAKLLMKRMGMIRPYNIGPGWKKMAQPDAEQLRERLMLPFDALLPAHGKPVLKDADSLFQPVLKANH